MSSTTLDRNKLIQKLLQQLSSKSLEQKHSNQFPLLTCDYLGGKLSILLGYPEIRIYLETPCDSFGGVIFVDKTKSLKSMLEVTFDIIDESLVKQAQIEVQNESPRFH